MKVERGLLHYFYVCKFFGDHGKRFRKDIQERISLAAEKFLQARF